MRLIDADKLEISMIAEFTDEYGDAVPVYGVTAEDIDNAPTVSTSQWVSVKDRLPNEKKPPSTPTQSHMAVRCNRKQQKG